MPNITIYLGKELYPKYLTLSTEEQDKLKQKFKEALAKKCQD